MKSSPKPLSKTHFIFINIIQANLSRVESSQKTFQIPHPNLFLTLSVKTGSNRGLECFRSRTEISHSIPRLVFRFLVPLSEASNSRLIEVLVARAPLVPAKERKTVMEEREGGRSRNRFPPNDVAAAGSRKESTRARTRQDYHGRC